MCVVVGQITVVFCAAGKPQLEWNAKNISDVGVYV